ncbi:MAG: hypothetical protein H7Y11_10465, partial [Armatimonadetes bacterium]|nr:hypothetical protein [Anaerolineae bacterium]
MNTKQFRTRNSVLAVVALVAMLAVLVVNASAQTINPAAPTSKGSVSLSRSGTANGVSVVTPRVNRAPVSITQSVDTTTITSGNSVACNNGVAHTDNSYYRVFDLAADFSLPNGMTVTSVDLGLEQLTGGNGAQPMEINLYTTSTNPPTLASLTLLGSTAFSVPDAQSVVSNFPINNVFVPAGSTLVVEIFTPDGAADGNLFFIGSNANGENDPTYLAAADCGITNPTPVAGIGFPDMHIVMVVNGDDTLLTPAPTNTPT